jgi:hypothetical protein
MNGVCVCVWVGVGVCGCVCGCGCEGVCVPNQMTNRVTEISSLLVYIKYVMTSVGG